MASHLISLRTIHRGTSQHIARPASMKFMSHLHVAAWTILEVGRIYFISSASWCPVRRSRRSWQMMDVNRNLKLAHWFHIEWPTLTNWHSRMLWCGRKSNCVGVEILWGTAIKGHCSKPWANRSSQVSGFSDESLSLWIRPAICASYLDVADTEPLRSTMATLRDDLPSAVARASRPQKILDNPDWWCGADDVTPCSGRRFPHYSDSRGRGYKTPRTSKWSEDKSANSYLKGRTALWYLVLRPSKSSAAHLFTCIVMARHVMALALVLTCTLLLVQYASAAPR